MVMRKLRKKVKLILWIVVFAFVAWIFFQLGADIVGRRIAKPWERGIIAEIDGTNILYKTYYALFQKLYQDSSKAKGGRELTDFEENRIEEQAWQELIQRVRWKEVFNKRGLHLKDQTVLTLLQYMPPKELMDKPEFQDSTGKFDQKKYLAALGDPRNLPYFENYEMQLREDIPKAIVQADLILFPDVSLEEAYDQFLLKNTKYKIAYVEVMPRKIPDSLVKYTEEDLKAYYNSHKDKYMLKERINLELVKFLKAPSHEDTLTALDRIKTAIEEIKSGTPFEEAAKYYSDDDRTRDKGGYLGWVKKKFIPKELVPVVETLKIGKISDPVITKSGWEIVKIEKRTPDSLALYHILVRIRTSTTTKEQVKQRAEDFVKAARKLGFEEALKEFKLKSIETKPFPRDLGIIPYLGEVKPLLEFVKKAKQGDISPLIRRPNYYVVAYVKEVLPEEEPEWKDIEKHVKMDFIREKKHELAKEIASKIYRELKGGKDFKELENKYGDYVKIKTDLPEVTLSMAIPGIPYNSEPYGALYVAKAGDLIPPVEAAGNFYVIKVLEKKVPGKEEFEKKEMAIRTGLRNKYLNLIWESWNREMSTPKELKDYRQYMLY